MSIRFTIKKNHQTDTGNEEFSLGKKTNFLNLRSLDLKSRRLRDLIEVFKWHMRYKKDDISKILRVSNQEQEIWIQAW